MFHIFSFFFYLTTVTLKWTDRIYIDIFLKIFFKIYRNKRWSYSFYKRTLKIIYPCNSKIQKLPATLWYKTVIKKSNLWPNQYYVFAYVYGEFSKELCNIFSEAFSNVSTTSYILLFFLFFLQQKNKKKYIYQIKKKETWKNFCFFFFFFFFASPFSLSSLFQI